MKENFSTKLFNEHICKNVSNNLYILNDRMSSKNKYVSNFSNVNVRFTNVALQIK